MWALALNAQQWVQQVLAPADRNIQRASEKQERERLSLRISFCHLPSLHFNLRSDAMESYLYKTSASHLPPTPCCCDGGVRLPEAISQFYVSLRGGRSPRRSNLLLNG